MIRADKLFIRDLVSTNGTFVNNEQIQGEIELKHGDKISLGALLFAVVIEQPAPVLPATVKILAPAASSQEEDAAALLLSLTDEPSAPPRSEAPTESDMPAGTVEHPLSGAESAAAASAAATPASKLEQIKQAQADTSVAASAILTKYLRRR